MRITLFKSMRDDRPVALDLTWDQLAARLAEDNPTHCPTVTHYTHEGQKLEIPAPVCPSLTRHPTTGERLVEKCDARKVACWSPAIWPDGHIGRRQENVTGSDLLVFDLDHISLATLKDIDTRIQGAGYAALMHSSHSNDLVRDDVCVRLVLKASCTMTPQEIRATRKHLEQTLGLPVDKATHDLGHLYFWPSRPALGAPPVFGRLEGRDVDPLTGEGVGPSSVSSVGLKAPLDFSYRTNGDMQALTKFLRKEYPNDDLVRRLLEGLPVDEPGKRDTSMNALASRVAWALPDASIEALVEMGRRMCASMDPENDLDKWRDKLTRAAGRKDADMKEKAYLSTVKFEGHRKESARSHPDVDKPDNNAPFSDDLVNDWASKAGCTRDEFQKQWIIRYHGANWVFVNGRYDRAVPDSDVAISLRRDLARAPVVITMLNKAGDIVPRPSGAILYEYGTAARAVQASLSLQESRYDMSNETFHEAVCPIRRDLKPQEHPEIHEWLRVFGGDTLLDWVACVTRLDKPAAALYVEGPPGTGKNVLVDGLARLWHKGGASAFKDVVGSNFNDSLTRCPLIHADEGIPKTDTIIDDLRRLIGSGTQPLNRKFMPVVSLEGNPRLIITANNDRVLLDTGAQLGPSDIEAITARIRQIKATSEAVDYLAQRRNTHGHGYIESWIKDDHLAKHALWLAENRDVDTKARFLVAGHNTEQAEKMTTGTGLVGAVVEFLARYLSDEAAPKTAKLQYGKGRLLVNTEALADRHQWERFVTGKRIPSAKLISDSLRAISNPEAVELSGHLYFDVKPHIVINWAKQTQVGSVQKIESLVNE